jgi:hypothetical protein
MKRAIVGAGMSAGPSEPPGRKSHEIFLASGIYRPSKRKRWWVRRLGGKAQAGTPAFAVHRVDHPITHSPYSCLTRVQFAVFQSRQLYRPISLRFSSYSARSISPRARR